jgi:hypothetical protein
MKPYEIEEKNQINIYSITSLGISLTTRHGIAKEMAEMLNFSYLVSRKGLQKYLVSVFYDSVSCCCSFEFLPLFEEFSQASKSIKACALQSIGQFDWFDCIHHGDLD